MLRALHVLVCVFASALQSLGLASTALGASLCSSSVSQVFLQSPC